MPTIADYSVPSNLCPGVEQPLEFPPSLLGNLQDQASGGLLSSATASNAFLSGLWVNDLQNQTITAHNNIVTYNSVGTQTYIYPPIQWPTQSITSPVMYYNYPYLYQTQNLVYFNFIDSRPETLEQKVAREEQEVKRLAATKRAEDLLLLHLNDEQIKQYLTEGYFETVVNDKIYRINKGRAGNVYLIEKGKTKYKYCAHPAAYTPEGDAMLAQLLMLKTDEERFIKTANRTILS
jgi:hypothetical protein